jgi:hypothetical protein
MSPNAQTVRSPQRTRQAVMESTDSSALMRGLVHGVLLSCVIWAAIGYGLTILR